MTKTYKLGSWNVNGLRACMTKGFMDFFTEENFDILGLQEIKMTKDQGDFSFKNHHDYWYSAEKKGYAGTALLTLDRPLTITYGLGITDHDNEGRIITAEYENFYFITVYTPNAKRDLSRLNYRMTWEDDFRTYVTALKQKKGVIICGDLNVAHRKIDLKNPKSNQKNAGFTREEREKMTHLLDAGFVDTFRYLNPNLEGAYTWWSYMNKARDRNIGWRIDYFLVSEDLVDNITDVKIYTNILGSDHCPVGLTLTL